VREADGCSSPVRAGGDECPRRYPSSIHPSSIIHHPSSIHPSIHPPIRRWNRVPSKDCCAALEPSSSSFPTPLPGPFATLTNCAVGGRRRRELTMMMTAVWGAVRVGVPARGSVLFPAGWVESNIATPGGWNPCGWKIAIRRGSPSFVSTQQRLTGWGGEGAQLGSRSRVATRQTACDMQRLPFLRRETATATATATTATTADAPLPETRPSLGCPASVASSGTAADGAIVSCLPSHIRYESGPWFGSERTLMRWWLRPLR